jgi:hypothetical protein
VKQKGTWRKNSDTEVGSSSKILQVVGDDRVGMTRDRKLGHHIVVRIPKQWTPQEEDVLLVRNETQVVNEGGNVRRASCRGKVAQQRGLILDYQGNRHGDLEPSTAKKADELERRAQA